MGDDFPFLGPSGPRAAEITRRICLDRETEDLLNRQAVAAGQEACSKVDVRTAGNELLAKAVCNMGGVKMTSEATTTFVGDTASTTKIHTTFEPPLAGRSESDTQDDAIRARRITLSHEHRAGDLEGYRFVDAGEIGYLIERHCRGERKSSQVRSPQSRRAVAHRSLAITR